MADIIGFYDCTFGKARMWVASASTTEGRSLVTHEPAAGDNYGHQDHGAKELTARLSLLFDRMVGETMSPVDRLQLLRSEIDGKPRIFRHPILGSFSARISEFSHEIDERSIISATCMVHQQTDETPAVTGAGAGGSLPAGQGAVAASAAAAKASLAAIGVDSTITDEAAATVDAWTAGSETAGPRQIAAESKSLTQRIYAKAAELEQYIEKWGGYRGLILMAEDVAAAAEAATEDSVASMVMRLNTTVAARALISSVYPADEFDERYGQFTRLNDIDNPSNLAPGVLYLMPRPSGKPRTS